MTTYCDNEDLMNQILQQQPSNEGLYEHELAILIPAYQLGATTKGFFGEGYMCLHYLIEQPQSLAMSMVERGYLRLSTDEELIDLLRYRELKPILKKHNVKPGTSTDTARKKAKEYLSLSDVLEEIDYKFYLLTDKGLSALQSNADIILFENGHSSIELNVRHDIQHDSINRDDLTSQIDLHTSCPYYIRYNWESKYPELSYLNSGWTPFYNKSFDSARTIFITKDGSSIEKIYNVKIVRILPTIHVLIIGCDEGQNGNYIWYAYSFNDMSFLPFYSVLPSDMVYLHHYKIPYHATRSTTNSNDNNTRTMYLSEKGIIGDAIINNVLSERCEIKLLDNMFPNDNTRNYSCKFPRDDIDTYSYIVYLLRSHHIDYTSIYGIPIISLLNYYCLLIDFQNSEREDILRIITLNELCLISQTVVIMANRLLKYFNNNIQEAIDCICNYYNYIPMAKDPYYDDTIEYIVQHEQSFEKRLKQNILNLKESGFIDARWINEFTLYNEIKKHYPNTIYQYRSDWLGLQSIDIFIPDLQIGIEYQGAQHYEPIEYFGGEEGLRYRKELDRKKKDRVIGQKVCLGARTNRLHLSRSCEAPTTRFPRPNGRRPRCSERPWQLDASTPESGRRWAAPQASARSSQAPPSSCSTTRSRP